jgi:hypothetical protein
MGCGHSVTKSFISLDLSSQRIALGSLQGGSERSAFFAFGGEPPVAARLRGPSCVCKPKTYAAALPLRRVLWTCIPSGLHPALAEDAERMPAVQQGVGICQDRANRRFLQRRLEQRSVVGTGLQRRVPPACVCRSELDKTLWQWQTCQTAVLT